MSCLETGISLEMSWLACLRFREAEDLILCHVVIRDELGGWRCFYLLRMDGWRGRANFDLVFWYHDLCIQLQQQDISIDHSLDTRQRAD